MVLALGGLTACGGGAEDGRNPMGSQAVVTSSNYAAVFVASADEGVITRVDADALSTERVAVSGEPTRLARAGGALWATLRTERAVVELVEGPTGLTVGRRLEVGAEPYGIVATEDGTRVYVAVSMEDKVLELDPLTLDVLRAWAVPGEPRWLALHPSGASLFVGGRLPNAVFHVDLGSGAATQVPLPEPVGFDFRTGADAPLVPRVTGDLAASPKGDVVAIPTLYVNHSTPIPEPEPGEPASPEVDGYGGRMNPTVTLVKVDGQGKPKDERPRMVRVSTFEAGSYPASVTFSPDGKYVLSTLEGAKAISVVPTERERDGFFDFGGGSVDIAAPPGAEAFEFTALEVVGVEAGPRGVAFVSDDRAFVYNFLDRTVVAIDFAQVRDILSGEGPPRIGPSVASIGRAVVAESDLPPEVEQGRRLFYAADDARVALPGGNVSCATCHIDGRDDGLTWHFDRGPRQTPSLAGMVSLREPVTWSGEQATVADDAMGTSQGLMGGDGLSMEDAQNIAAFIDYARSVDLPAVDAAAAARGQAIFERADTQCSGCHAGPLYTDKAFYDMYGFRGVKTPSLLGVAASAPYLHDGSAPTLRAVLESARGAEMGDTSALTDAEMSDLEVYLRSL